MKTAQKIVNNSIKENRLLKDQLIKLTYVIFGHNPFL